MTNFEWLSSINPMPPSDWHNDSVIRISDIANYQFYNKDEKYYRAVIDPQAIKGISYGYAYNCFSDISWLELLNSLKRFSYVQFKFSSFEDIVEHIHNDYNEPKTVFKYGDILITACGQHRMALAKFLKIPAVEVNVVDYKFDFDSFHKYQIRKRNIEFLQNANLLNELYKLTHQNYDDRFISVKIFGKYFSLDTLYLDDLVSKYDGLQKPGFLKQNIFKIHSYLYTTRFHNQISSKGQIQNFSYLLSKHKFEGTMTS